MKISIDIDCTPEEARHFLGLPDVKPIQEAMMAEMQKRMSSTMTMMDPEPMMKAFMSGAPAMEAFQNMMWKAATSALEGGRSATGTGNGDTGKKK